MKIIKLYAQNAISTQKPPIVFPDFDTYSVEGGNVNVQVDRYQNSRFWQVTVNGNLLAVVVYRKGALAIKELIEKLSK